MFLLMIGGGMAALVMAPVILAVTIVLTARLLGRGLYTPVVHGLVLLLAAAALRATLAHDLRPVALSEGVFFRLVVTGVTGLAVAFVIVNWSGRPVTGRIGLTVILVGAAANAVPALIDGAMPVSAVAANNVGYSRQDELSSYVGYAPPADGSAWRTIFGDVIHRSADPQGPEPRRCPPREWVGGVRRQHRARPTTSARAISTQLSRKGSSDSSSSDAIRRFASHSPPGGSTPRANSDKADTPTSSTEGGEMMKASRARLYTAGASLAALGLAFYAFAAPLHQSN